MAGKGEILVVDDTTEDLVTLTDILTSEGYQVRPADSGELALSSIEAAPADLILLDVRMPGMDGFKVCRHLKAREATRHIPVIFISGITEIEERVEGLKLGAVDFVYKPFRKEELLARLETHLELGRLRKRLEEKVAERTAELAASNERLQVELTERIRTERALRESEARFRDMADTAPVMIWTSGPDANVDFCNQYTLDFTGRRLEELIQDGWKDVVHPDDLKVKHAACTRTFEAPDGYQVEYRVRRADGEYRWVLDTATPRLLENGEVAGYIGVQMDITDLKRNQEHLAAAQKLESLGVLVAGVAHNFNNQMGTILAEADLALSELPPDSPAHGNLERINAAAMRAAGVVALLVSYAGARTKPGAGRCELSSVVEETVRLFKATVSKEVEFRMNLAHNLAVIRADVSEIRQVIMNLLTNAWESLENNRGRIEVSTYPLDIRGDSATGDQGDQRPGQYVCLKVADTGGGIPEAARDRIFDPFYTTKGLGRGLGLAAVQGIVRSRGGAIHVRTTPKKGSTFEIRLLCGE